MPTVNPYQFEPEYSSDEIGDSCEEISDEETCALSQCAASSRVGKEQSTWCSCGFCEKMPTEAECLCCKEPSFLSNMGSDLPCLTLHEDFKLVCLNKGVLWTALVSLHDRESAGVPARNQVPNRSFRYAAYRQFTWWAHGHLGKKIHRVIPSCVINNIRSKFPEEDGCYVGFKAGDDDSDMVTEVQSAWIDFVNEL